jgi:RNA polymerase sigma-70 factor (ECF subfamily)
VQPSTDDPATIVAFRASVRLALVASRQYLPPRQRAVLLLRDVLGMTAPDVATVLETTPIAVKSTLQRARARLQAVRPQAEDVSEPEERSARELLDRYIAAFEQGDPHVLTGLLREDATIEAPPFPTWVEGRATCTRYLEKLLVIAGQYRMIPTVANGQPAAVTYHRGEDGSYRAFGIGTLLGTPFGIAQIIAFCDANLVRTFGYPEDYPHG